MRTARLAATLELLFAGEAQAQAAVRLFRAAILRRRSTAVDARAIGAAVKAYGDRVALQEQADRIGQGAGFRRASQVRAVASRR